MSTVKCPGCGRTGRFPPQFIGKPIKCRQCGARFTATPELGQAGGDSAAPASPAKLPPFELQTPASASSERAGGIGTELSEDMELIPLVDDAPPMPNRQSPSQAELDRTQQQT